MSSESEERSRSLSKIAGLTGSYPEAAYHFVREGLEYAARSVHGPMTPAQFVLAQYMADEKIDLPEVFERYERGDLDPVASAAVEQCGERDRLNRNVSGEDLCWALREFALRRWGMLARLVLGRWGITRTGDFGEIVFTLIEHGMMQKEPHDTLEHFKAVYDFHEAMDRSFRITDESNN